MQFTLEKVCNIKDENLKRKLSAFRASLLLFLNIVTDIAVIITDWNPNTLYIWSLLFFNFHGCLQLSISIYLRYENYLLGILGFFGVGQVASLFKIWRHIENNDQYRQLIHYINIFFFCFFRIFDTCLINTVYHIIIHNIIAICIRWMEVCWIQTTMITIPSIALQIWSMTAFTDVSLKSYSIIKIISVTLGILSIGPTIVSLEKFMNEHAQGTMQKIQKNMEQQKEISNQLMQEIEQNAFMSFEDEENENNENNEHDENNGNDINNNNAQLEHENVNGSIQNGNGGGGGDSDSDDGFDLDGDVDDGYIRNKLDPQHSLSMPTMNETESQSRYDSYYKLKKPKLEIIQYSNLYYYGFVSLIPSDFVIRVVSIGFIQRIIFGDDINNLHCMLWYTIIIYFIIWRFTYSESYGDTCWGYRQYDKIQTEINKKCPVIGILMKTMIVICYNIMPSGYMFYGNFHRELYPKILILINNACQLLLFIVFLYVFNRHLDGHHEKIIQYEMRDDYEDIVLIVWQIVLAVAWLIYVISLYLFHREGTKQLEEQLETLIPSYEDEVPHEY